MRHAFLLAPPLPLSPPEPTLAFSVLQAPPRRRLVPSRCLPPPPQPGPLAAPLPAILVSTVAMPAYHHQPTAASAAELPSIMRSGCLQPRFDEPPGRTGTKLDLRPALCETRDLSTSRRSSTGFRGRRLSCGTGAPASFFSVAAAEPTSPAASSQKTWLRLPPSRARDHADARDRRQ